MQSAWMRYTTPVSGPDLSTRRKSFWRESEASRGACIQSTNRPSLEQGTWSNILRTKAILRLAVPCSVNADPPNLVALGDLHYPVRLEVCLTLERSENTESLETFIPQSFILGP